MMHPYPFFGAPHYRRPYYYHPNPNLLHNSNKKEVNVSEEPCFPNNLTNANQGTLSRSSNSYKNKKNDNCNFEKTNNNQFIETDSNECFEIFGLKLHFDDLLIIALLFFLYQEDVKDTYLYIALILLLLS